MVFYCNDNSITIADTVNNRADLTAAQVTVSSVQGRLLYNIEYKPPSNTVDDFPSAPKRRVTDPRIDYLKKNDCSTHQHSRANSTDLKTSSPHVGAAASAVAARFNYHHANRSRTHSRRGSSFSDNIISASPSSSYSSHFSPSTLSSNQTISSDSMWEDWIVKYIHEDKNALVGEDASMEDWIFETM